MIGQQIYEEFVIISKALADETRLRIVEMLSHGEMCGCDILKKFKISQPTLSYHIKILTDCALLIGRRQGIWMFYRLNPEKVAWIQQFWDNIETHLHTSNQAEQKEEG